MQVSKAFKRALEAETTRLLEIGPGQNIRLELQKIDRQVRASSSDLANLYQKVKRSYKGNPKGKAAALNAIAKSQGAAGRASALIDKAIAIASQLDHLPQR